MLGAKNHSIKAIGVLWGYGTQDELSDAGADALCHHPNEIFDQVFTQEK
jgi:phosphoglycolate phosphatase